MTTLLSHPSFTAGPGDQHRGPDDVKREPAQDQPSKPTQVVRRVLQTLTALAAAVGAWAAAAPLGGSAPFVATIFALAVWAWMATTINDTFVALAATVALVAGGALTAEDFFAPLGASLTWLLIGAFVLAAAVTQTGLAVRIVARACAHAVTARALVHTVAALAAATAFAVPATSGRAALLLPVFGALATTVVQTQPWLTKVLALLIPTTVLFTAAASLIGAGAHLITVQVLTTSGEDPITFTQWLIWGVPYAAIMTVMSAEIVLLAFTTPAQRAQPLELNLAEKTPTPQRHAQQRTAIAILAGAVIAWLTQSLHGLDPAVVAVVAALLVTAPGIGVISLPQAMKKVPFHLIIFMAATVALARALMDSGISEALGTWAASLLGDNPIAFVWGIIIASALAHLVIQSRSARSAVLIPLVVALAPQMGLDPVAAAFASTVAAGLSHTLPASAKPLAIFAAIDDHPTFDRRDLIRLSLILAPLHIAVTGACAFFLWPVLGLSLN